MVTLKLTERSSALRSVDYPDASSVDYPDAGQQFCGFRLGFVRDCLLAITICTTPFATPACVTWSHNALMPGPCMLAFVGRRVMFRELA